MESQFVWQEEFNIGVESIDRDHQKLFKIINKLFALKEEGKNDQWACQESIKFFRAHATNHFASEEAYMASIHFDGLEAHREVHRTFRENTLPALEHELEQTEYSTEAIDHFLGVCAGWLIGHTLTDDQSITGKHIHRWKNLLPGEEQTAFKKVIKQLVFDMFHLESKLISDVYGGEKFGKGIYYHLIYGCDQNEKKQEVLMIFEDKVLINTVGKIMGIQTNKLDDMLIHAARYTARQFVQRVIESFPAMDGYHLEGENLLFYDQFKTIFQRQQPQASLLFDTGVGYFAFCIIAPHLLEQGVGSMIQPERAMTEVEEYLNRRKEKHAQRKAEHKQKILIVDDSATIREGIKRLLGEKYEVATAESGVAAIRSVTLDRPDLVLLDYEMPVCDGRQTLEMLRSEKEFEDLPVIFLTGRRDPQSMIQVMPLKPAGYLIKSSKPDSIKKEIEAFFEKKKDS